MSFDGVFPSKHRSQAVLLTAVFLGLTIPQVAFSEPVELFRAGVVEHREGGYRVTGAASLVQLRVSPRMVLSASGGAAFELSVGANAEDSSTELNVRTGTVRIVLLEAQTLYALGPGTYGLPPDAAPTPMRARPSTEELAESIRLPEFGDRQAVYLADTAMFRQDKLLEVPTTPFVRGLLSLFRR